MAKYLQRDNEIFVALAENDGVKFPDANNYYGAMWMGGAIALTQFSKEAELREITREEAQRFDAKIVTFADSIDIRAEFAQYGIRIL